jgi:hypothetical protein
MVGEVIEWYVTIASVLLAFESLERFLAASCAVSWDFSASKWKPQGQDEISE